MTNHPITPPPKMVGDWLTEAADLSLLVPANLDYLAARAAQWGSDQELEACCKCLTLLGCSGTAAEVRAARRPKPPSLKEQALEALEVEDDAMPLRSLERSERFDTIRRALEALPND